MGNPSWSQGLAPLPMAARVVALLDFAPAWEAFSKALVEGGELARAFAPVAPALVRERARLSPSSSRECFLNYDDASRSKAIESFSLMCEEDPELARAVAPRQDPDAPWWEEQEDIPGEGEFAWDLAAYAMGSGLEQALARLKSSRALEGLWRSFSWAGELAWLSPPASPAMVEIALGPSWEGPANLGQDWWRAALRSPALTRKALDLLGPSLARSLRLSTLARVEGDPASLAQSVEMVLEAGAFGADEVAKAMKACQRRPKSASVACALERWLLADKTPAAPTARRIRM